MQRTVDILSSVQPHIKILLVLSRERSISALTTSLEAENFTVVSSVMDRGAEEILCHEDTNLMILDAQLPELEVADICRRLRDTPEFGGIPVIVLATGFSKPACVQVLESGATDCLVRPFSIRELIARIRAHLRTAQRRAQVLRFDELELNCLSCDVRRGGRRVAVTTIEFALLEYLMRHPGIVFSRQQLLESVWGQTHLSARTVDTYIYRLRQKIEANPAEPLWIRSFSGFGYLFEPPLAT